MSQAKTGWQQAFNTCRLLIKNRQFQQLGRQTAVLGVVALLWWMNPKLFLATSVGIGAMLACYLSQNSHWQNYCQKWQRFLVGSNRQLTLAVAAGASGAFCTYLAASIWTEAENQWLATGSILQSTISLATLICLLWSIRSQKATSVEDKLEQLLLDLSNGDRLKCLVAIRQLTRLLVNNRLSAEHYSQSIEYYRLMLSQPQPTVIKDALLESLNILGAEQLQQSAMVKIPLQLNTRKPVLDLNS